MRYSLILLSLILFTLAFAKPHPRVNLDTRTHIAIMDTGLDVTDPRFASHICGEYDLTNTEINDSVGHGTHVAGIISNYLKDKSYCLIILKVFNSPTTPPDQANKSLYSAYQIIKELRPDVVNFSGGGPGVVDSEEEIIASIPDTMFIVAAGNENKDIRTTEGSFFPASFLYKNIIPVGSIGYNGHKSSYSNFGDGVVWELGELIDSTLPYNINSKGHGLLSGTSMATALRTAKYVYENY